VTAANESEEDQEFAIDELSGRCHQPDATFAPGGIGMLSDRSKLSKGNAEGQ